MALYNRLVKDGFYVLRSLVCSDKMKQYEIMSLTFSYKATLKYFL